MIGSRLGPYEITAALGAGGMGEVFRARDTRLGRDVALKVLPAAFAQDADRLARFRREAHLLAALNDAHIAAIHGLEEIDGVVALALELAPGEDLAQRLNRGPIPVDEALAIARQIAEGLEAAHEHGIVHRDLKPANIKIAPDGKVKILDFGLAKAWEGDAAASANVSHSPTVTRATAAGVILGTAAYMSPEQARGKPVDKRADIWAFGVIVWEMLTGRRLFEGETVSDVLAAVLKTSPDLDALPADVPPRVRRVIAHCLRKDPRERLHDIADARIELMEAEEAAPPIRSRSGRPATPVVPWVVAALAAGGAAWSMLGRRAVSDPARALSLSVLPPAGTISSGPIDISRDGSQVVFTAAGADGIRRLYVRQLNDLEPRRLPGTEGGDAPFFSPDGRSVGFFAEGRLKRVDLAGGPPREVAAAPNPRGGNWGADGIIIFAPEGSGPLFRVAAAGGEVSPATTLDTRAGENSHRWPRFLADGKRFLYMSRKPAPPGRLTIWAGSTGGHAATRLTDAHTSGTVSQGRLYFMREATLFAQALDERTLTLGGEPAPVAERVWRDPTVDGISGFAVADDGTIAYRRGGVGTGQLTWLDRQGRVVGTLGPPGVIGSVALAPDGRHVLLDLTDDPRELMALFVTDVVTGMMTRVTFSAGNYSSGIYSPDGRQFVFAWDGRGAFDLYRQEVGGAGDPVPLLASTLWKYPNSWSPNGRFLAFTQNEPGQTRDIWILPMTGDGRPFPFAQMPADEWSPTFSPDGRFLAYVSDESGRPEVFIRAFPVGAGKWPVSMGGGMSPVWGRDGGEIFYLRPDRTVMAAPIAWTGGRPVPGAATPLFQNVGLRPPTAALGAVNPFDVAPDGRFLANLRPEEVDASPIVLKTGVAR